MLLKWEGECHFQHPPRWLLPVCSGSTEQTGEQRDEGRADQHHAAASHELLNALRFSRRIIVSVAFHEVNNTPHCETRAEGDNKRLENRNCLIFKCLT